MGLISEISCCSVCLHTLQTLHRARETERRRKRGVHHRGRETLVCCSCSAFGQRAANSCSVLSSRSSLSLAPQVWHHPLWLLSPGMSALQLQNLATLAAAAAAAQNSASPSTANPLSSSAASLGALASPGNTAATQAGGVRRRGEGGQRLPTSSALHRSHYQCCCPHDPGTSLPSPKPSTCHRRWNHLHCSDSLWHVAHGVCIHRLHSSDLHLSLETMLCCWCAAYLRPAVFEHLTCLWTHHVLTMWAIL